MTFLKSGKRKVRSQGLINYRHYKSSRLSMNRKAAYLKSRVWEECCTTDCLWSDQSSFISKCARNFCTASENNLGTFCEGYHKIWHGNGYKLAVHMHVCRPNRQGGAQKAYEWCFWVRFMCHWLLWILFYLKQDNFWVELQSVKVETDEHLS